MTGAGTLEPNGDRNLVLQCLSCVALSKRIHLSLPCSLSKRRRKKDEGHNTYLAGVLSGTKQESSYEVLGREQMLLAGQSPIFPSVMAFAGW